MPRRLRRPAQLVQWAVAWPPEVAAGRRPNRRAEVVAATGQDKIRHVPLACPPGAFNNLGAHARRRPDLVLITGEQDHVAFDGFERDPGRAAASLSSRRS